MNTEFQTSRDADVRLAFNRLLILVGDSAFTEEIQDALERMWEYGYQEGYSRGTVNADE